MDELDDRQVDACRRNGDVSARSGTSKLIRRRLRLLDPDDALEDVMIRVDYDRLGYHTVVVWLTVDPDATEDYLERLRGRPAFVTVYELSDTSDVFAVGKFPHELALASCLEGLLTDPDVRSVAVDPVETVVEEGTPIDPPSVARSR